jgi:Bacterial Ig-like domain (group 2)
MKKSLINIFFFVFVITFGIYTYANGQRRSITSVIVTPPFSYDLVGTEQQLTATVTGTGLYNSAVTWSTSFGTVNKHGVFTAPSTPGTAYITAISNEDHTKSSTVTIVVMPPVSSVTITPTNISVTPGQQIQFTATVQ